MLSGLGPSTTRSAKTCHLCLSDDQWLLADEIDDGEELPESSTERRIAVAELMDLLIEKGIVDQQDIAIRREQAV